MCPLCERTLIRAAQLTSRIATRGLTIHGIRAVLGLLATAAAHLVDERTAASGARNGDARAFLRRRSEATILLQAGLTVRAGGRIGFTDDALAAGRARLANPEARAHRRGQLVRVASRLVRARSVVHVLDTLDALSAPLVFVTIAALGTRFTDCEALIGAKSARFELRTPDRAIRAAATATFARALAGARAFSGAGVGAPSLTCPSVAGRVSAVRAATRLRGASSTLSVTAAARRGGRSRYRVSPGAACVTASTAGALRLSAGRSAARSGRARKPPGWAPAACSRDAPGPCLAVPVARPATAARSEGCDHHSMAHHPKPHGSQSSINRGLGWS